MDLTLQNIKRRESESFTGKRSAFAGSRCAMQNASAVTIAQVVIRPLRFVGRWRAPRIDSDGSGLDGMHFSMALRTRKSMSSLSRSHSALGVLSVVEGAPIVAHAALIASVSLARSSGKLSSVGSRKPNPRGRTDPRRSGSGCAVDGSGEPSVPDAARFGMGISHGREALGGPGLPRLTGHRPVRGLAGCGSGETVGPRSPGCAAERAWPR